MSRNVTPRTSHVAALETARTRRRSTLLKRTLGYPQTRIGVGLAIFIILVAFVGPLLAPHSPSAFVGAPFTPPNPKALLGTDYLGEDVLSQVLHGGANVLWMAVSASVLGVALGIVVGLIAGYTGGWLDAILMRFQDIVLAFPQLVFVLLFISLIGPKEWLIVVLVAIVWMPGLARTTRGITLEVTTREYVQAAEVLGYRRSSILFGEVLPNLTTPLMVEFGLRLTWSIALIAGLSFLGLGVQPPTPDWGLMVNENRNGISVQPLAVLMPMVLIAIFAIATNLITEGFARAMAGIDRKSDA